MRWALLLVVVACVSSSEVVCENGLVCPTGARCDLERDRCIGSEQLAACAELEDGATCEVFGASGVCVGDVCEPQFCGDGMAIGIEDCDRDDLRGATCASEHFYGETTGLACRSDCTFDTSGCVGACGDDILNGMERCDGPELGGATCLSAGFYEAAGLTCSPFCTWDVSQCKGTCGDDIVHGAFGEICDGLAPPDTCLTFGFDLGLTPCSGACAPSLLRCDRLGWFAAAPGTNASLLAVWGTGSEAFAVGVNGTILHTDGGGTWTVMTSPTNVALLDVWGSSASDVFAVGDTGTILHYNGTAWTAMTSGTVFHLRGVFGTGPNDVYAVGDLGTIRHYDGTTWSTFASGTSSADFEGVFKAGSTLFVTSSTIVRKHDGNAWSTITPAGAARLNEIWGTSPTNVYLVGENPRLGRYNGSTWDPAPAAATSVLYDVWGTGPGNIFAVGFGGLTLHFDGVAWRKIDSGVAETLRGVGGSAAGDIYAVGPNATLLHDRGARWFTSNWGIDADILSVWGSGPGDVYAVGINGAMRRYDGTAWTPHTSSPANTNTLNDVWGSGPTDIFAVGLSGTILHSTGGGAWAPMTSNTSGNLLAVHGTGPSNVFAVGAVGTIVRYTGGAAWDAATPMVTGPLNGVWTTGNVAFAVGYAGTILHFNGASWMAMTSGTGYDLRAVWGSSASDVFAVGRNGTILHYDGTSWQPMTSPTTLELFSISGSGPDDVYATSASDVFHFDGKRWSAMTSGTSIALHDVEVIGTDAWFVEGVANVSGASETVSRLIHPCVATETGAHCHNQWDDDCDGLLNCEDPECAMDLYCTAGGVCGTATTLACGTSVAGDNRAMNEVELYDCSPRIETGPEAYYRFSATTTGMVTATLANATVDLDLLALGSAPSGACDPSGQCIAAASTTTANDTLSFAVTAGQTYYLAVDGYAGAVGEFTLSLSCP